MRDLTFDEQVAEFWKNADQFWKDAEAAHREMYIMCIISALAIFLTSAFFLFTSYVTKELLPFFAAISFMPCAIAYLVIGKDSYNDYIRVKKRNNK